MGNASKIIVQKNITSIFQFILFSVIFESIMLFVFKLLDVISYSDENYFIIYFSNLALSEAGISAGGGRGILRATLTPS